MTRLSRLTPAHTGASFTVGFTNRAADDASLFWLSPSDDEVAMGAMAAGERKTFKSYAGHRWRARWANGAVVDATVQNGRAEYALQPAATAHDEL